MVELAQALAGAAAQVDDILDRVLSTNTASEVRLYEAMRYATLGGGKRLRPFLVLQSASLFNVQKTAALRAAAAIELVHCYSLVHDDLPAMDDDELRRGRPTTHRQFDEATAVLAGDALLTLAFEILAHPDTHSNPLIRADLTLELARAAGGQGMVGGQMIDLSAATKNFSIEEITKMQRLKTGALIAFACEAGAILGGNIGPAREALRNYAYDLGLAFQIVDDLLDVEGTVEETGKVVGKDDKAGKATFVGILGRNRARTQTRFLADKAIEHLIIFDDKADLLRSVAQFVVERRS